MEDALTEGVGEVEDGGGVQVPGAAEAAIGDAGGDVAENEGETHAVVDDQRQDHQELHGGAEQAEGLIEGHRVVLLLLARRGVGLHVGEEAEREDGDHAHEGEDDEQDGVVVGEVLDNTADQRSGEAAELENGEEDAIEGRGRFGKAYGECNSTHTLLDEVRESQTAQRPRYTPWAFQSIAAPTPTARLAIT